jgi:hypothetical protein
MGGWRKMYTEDFHNLYLSPNIVLATTPLRIKWAVLVTQNGKLRQTADPEGNRALCRYDSP